MATNYFKSIHHHHHHSLRRRHSIDCPRTTSSSASCSFLKPLTTKTTNTPSFCRSIFTTFSLSSSTSSTTSTAPSTTPQTVSFDILQQHLSSKDFRQADEETRRLFIVLAGEAAQKRGYVFFSEVQFISEDDIRTIDELWTKYSDKKYGYSVQKKIWKKVSKDFTKFFVKVGWMKRLDTEVEQYNYRSFPGEFMWEMSDETPEGHLPLTNALRGIQLLNSILTHPAFEGDDDEGGGGGATPLIDEKGAENGGPRSSSSSGKPPFGDRGFKPDYSF